MTYRSGPHRGLDTPRARAREARAGTRVRRGPPAPRSGASRPQAGESHEASVASEVRSGGLEPPRCYPLEPESSASTNSATIAKGEAFLPQPCAVHKRVKTPRAERSEASEDPRGLRCRRSPREPRLRSGRADASAASVRAAAHQFRHDREGRSVCATTHRDAQASKARRDDSMPNLARVRRAAGRPDATNRPRAQAGRLGTHPFLQCRQGVVAHVALLRARGPRTIQASILSSLRWQS